MNKLKILHLLCNIEIEPHLDYLCSHILRNLICMCLSNLGGYLEYDMFQNHRKNYLLVNYLIIYLFFTCISALGKKLEGQLTEKLIVLNNYLFNRLLNYLRKEKHSNTFFSSRCNLSKLPYTISLSSDKQH